ncbi:hypothetical protein BT63DRAFT_404651, partial [Microthyrium microscopicum]
MHSVRSRARKKTGEEKLQLQLERWRLRAERLAQRAESHQHRRRKQQEQDEQTHPDGETPLPKVESNEASKTHEPKGTLNGGANLRAQLKMLFAANIFRLLINLMFALVPAGFALYYTHADDLTVFFVNFFAVIPSAAIQGVAADELGLRLRATFTGRWGDIMAGLLNQTF